MEGNCVLVNTSHFRESFKLVKDNLGTNRKNRKWENNERETDIDGEIYV